MIKKKSFLGFISESTFIHILLSILFGFLVGAIFLKIMGLSVSAAYGRLLNSVTNLKGLSYVVVYSVPYIVAGLSVAFSFKTGVFNIGAEGQFVMGSMAAVVTSLLCANLPKPVLIPLCFLAAMAIGALWGIIVGVLKTKWGINEVLSMIMFNWIAFYLSNFIAGLPAIKSEGTAEATKNITDNASLLFSKDFIKNAGLCPTANWGILIAIVNGKKIEMNNPRDAINAGIGMVHQHFMLVQPFTVTENIVLGTEPTSGVKLDMATARKNVVEISERYGLSIDPDAKIEDISVGMQQRVEILKALYRGADILILDEPTSSLTPQEITELIQIMHNLVRDGKSIIIITHKLKEIKESADFCTIIRLGKYIGTVDVETTTENSLARMMVGRNVAFKVDKPEKEPGDVVLDIQDLHCLDYRDIEIVKGLNLQVRSGEIVGIAGIDGNGQTELVEVITGLRKGTSGKVLVKGVDVFNKSPRFGFDHGVSSIPADRQKHGLVLDFSIEDNLILQNYEEEPFSKNKILKRDPIFEHANQSIDKYDIRPQNSEKRAAGTLSGGNQQKVIIAREVQNDKDLLIAVNPTRGLDVGAIEYVHKYIVEQRNKGKAVLLVSFELDEIMSLSDTIKVIFDGQIVSSIPSKDAKESELGLMMAGGGKKK